MTLRPLTHAGVAAYLGYRIDLTIKQVDGTVSGIIIPHDWSVTWLAANEALLRYDGLDRLAGSGVAYAVGRYAEPVQPRPHARHVSHGPHEAPRGLGHLTGASLPSTPCPVCHAQQTGGLGRV